MLPDKLLNIAEEKIPREQTAGKILGVYFSANWCPPCRAFTPKLISLHNAHAEEFEVIMVGSDGNQEEQTKYMRKYAMPWLAIPNGSKEAKALAQTLEVSGIPHLVILAPNGNVISADGRQDLEAHGENAFHTWRKAVGP
ncbi:MAG: hypothetical protein CMJ96_07105 [Planctomycetes bacterium]|nr:hypothetical protein [Planctomycetota bacterium]